MARSTEPTPDRFATFLSRISSVLGHADRREPLRAYISGLLLPGERKSIEPIAARIDPAHVPSRHQSLHHFVTTAHWDEQEVIAVARDWALAAMERHGVPRAWAVDDSGIPKKGRASVGIARQYCGVLGKQENCQVAVSISIVHPVMSVPTWWRLYLPESWAGDAKRRDAAKVPKEIQFQPKWMIALDGIDVLLRDEVTRAPVVADAGYGDTTDFRDGLTKRGLPYIVGVHSTTTVWPEGKGPLPPEPRKPGRRGPTPVRLRRTREHAPISVLQLAQSLPSTAWTTVRWRDATQGTLASRFAATRVRPAHRDFDLHEARPEEWLLIEWPTGQKEPLHYSLSTLPADTSIEELVRAVKIRWRIERDYQELKDELGLDHFEGRSWRGFHHHGALCIAAYAYLAAERARLSPPEPLTFLRAAPIPPGFRPRGAASAG